MPPESIASDLVVHNNSLEKIYPGYLQMLVGGDSRRKKVT